MTLAERRLDGYRRTAEQNREIHTRPHLASGSPESLESSWPTNALDVARKRKAFARARQSGNWESDESLAERRRGPSDRAYYCETWPQGWRLLGRADEVCKREGSRRVDHGGWYTEDEGDSGTLAGYVLQIPARNGEPQYVPGTAHSEWDGVTLYPLDRYDSPVDAAAVADQIAERAAEKERDYNRAWQAGQRWADLGEEIAELRKGIIAAVRQFREARRSLRLADADPNGEAHWTGEDGAPTAGTFDRLCEIIRADVSHDLEEIRKARETREELTESVWTEYRSAFNEGAGSTVFA